LFSIENLEKNAPSLLGNFVTKVEKGNIKQIPNLLQLKMFFYFSDANNRWYDDERATRELSLFDGNSRHINEICENHLNKDKLQWSKQTIIKYQFIESKSIQGRIAWRHVAEWSAAARFASKYINEFKVAEE